MNKKVIKFLIHILINYNYIVTILIIINIMTETIKVKPFILNTLGEHATILLTAKRRQGKSTCIKSLIYFYYNIGIKVGIICSSSEHIDPFYQKFFPGSFIYDNCNKAFDKIWNRQNKIALENKKRKEKGEKEIDSRILVVLDDVIHDAKEWNKNESLRNIMFNGRHYGITLIIATQYLKALTPDIRANFDYFFIFNTNNIEDIKKIYETCGGMFGTQQTFIKIINECTKNYNILVIRNTGNPGSELSDNFGIFRAKLNLGPFMFGSDKFIGYHKKYYNKKWDEQHFKLKETGMIGTSKKNIRVMV